MQVLSYPVSRKGSSLVNPYVLHRNFLALQLRLLRQHPRQTLVAILFLADLLQEACIQMVLQYAVMVL